MVLKPLRKELPWPLVLSLLLMPLVPFLLDTTGSLGATTEPQEPQEMLYWPLDGPEAARAPNTPGELLICGPRWTEGPSGLALQFDGINDFVRIPHTPELALREAITVSLWVRLDRAPQGPTKNGFRFILAKPRLKSFSLVLEDDQTVQAAIHSGGERRSVRSRNILSIGQWTHVAFTYDGGSGLMKLYLDGQLNAQGEWPPGLIDVDERPLFLGSAISRDTPETQGGVRVFPGAIDEVRIYSRALPDEEVTALVQALPSLPQSPPAPGRVTFTVQVDGQPAPVRLILLSQDGQAACPEVAYAPQGALDLDLPPGRYLIQADHGGGFTSPPALQALEINPGQPQSVSLELHQVFNPRARNYYAADLHNHTFVSGDGVTPIPKSVLAQRAAGLDLAIVTDHNTAAAHEAFQAEAKRQGVPYLLSEEITTPDWGHFNIFPLPAGLVVLPKSGKTPQDYFTEARAKGAWFIQVNHPFWGEGAGYFHRADYPEFDRGFDAVEVFNGFNGLADRNKQAMQALFELWNAGKRYAATAGSDDHDTSELISQLGRPRTYVYLPEGLSATGWLAALRAQHAFVTTGPLVYLRAQGEAVPGDDVRLKAGEPFQLELEIESLEELSRLWIYRNGEVVHEEALSGQRVQIRWKDENPRTGWYAVYVEAGPGYRALTNPVWVWLD